jgi:hypothetical protein
MNIERMLLIGLAIGAVIGTIAYTIVSSNNLRDMLAEEQEKVMVMSMICGMPPPVRMPVPDPGLTVGL